MFELSEDTKKLLTFIGVGIIVVVFILLLAWLVMYLMYYKYSLLTGNEKMPYLLSTSTVSTSYMDLSNNNVAIIWPMGSIEYRPNDAEADRVSPDKKPLQYLPAITDGQWPSTFTYTLLYNNVYGPFSIASSQMVTVTPPGGKSVTMSYPIGSKVSATVDKHLNLICLFDGKGNVIFDGNSNAASAKRTADSAPDHVVDVSHDHFSPY